MPSKYAKAQIQYLEVLKEHGLLDLAISGKLPHHIEKAARQSVVAKMAGTKTNEDKTVIQCTQGEHDEAQMEIEEYLHHYRILRDLKETLEKPMPRNFLVGGKYVVASGWFKGRVVKYKGTDKEVWGAGWLDNAGNPACEKYIFRAQRDGLDVTRQALVFNLPNEFRDIVLQGHEIGQEVN